eukprot:TRINITY_DN19465_c0_g2_i2.p1 TRINITY_DN19465_c0_g2~~TRINITY_DN19465_c0_g2_i2.p1  ORF type:complete len:547 (+),score=121.01 TRINITY_DN19465_c0_g2_i2:140-1780(+)
MAERTSKRPLGNERGRKRRRPSVGNAAGGAVQGASPLAAEEEEAAEPLPEGPTGELVSLLRLLEPTTPCTKAVSEALRLLSSHVRAVFGKEASLVLFGSRLQGVHLDASDVDVSVQAPGCKSSQAEALLELLGQLREPFVVKEARLESHVRVPVLVLAVEVRGLQVEVDVTFLCDDEFARSAKGRTDRFIRKALLNVPRAVPLVRVIKLWARSEGLNNAFGGYINSLGWTLLCLFSLLSQGVTTPYDAWNLAKDDDCYEFAGVSTNGKPIVPNALRSTNWSCVASDVHYFFCMFEDIAASMEHGYCGLSLFYGFCERPGKDRSPLFVEDPGLALLDHYDNVARSLRSKQWADVCQRCAAAAAALEPSASVPAEAAASTWLRGLLNLPMPAAEDDLSFLEPPQAPSPTEDASSVGLRRSPDSLAPVAENVPSASVAEDPYMTIHEDADVCDDASSSLWRPAEDDGSSIALGHECAVRRQSQDPPSGGQHLHSEGQVVSSSNGQDAQKDSEVVTVIDDTPPRASTRSVQVEIELESDDDGERRPVYVL